MYRYFYFSIFLWGTKYGTSKIEKMSSGTSKNPNFWWGTSAFWGSILLETPYFSLKSSKWSVEISETLIIRQNKLKTRKIGSKFVWRSKILDIFTVICTSFVPDRVFRYKSTYKYKSTYTSTGISLVTVC